jgi:DNA-binding MarR family transcriptional regulator
MRKYLQFVERAQKINQKFDLSQYEIQMLDVAGRAHFLEGPIFVGDLIYHSSIASQATLHAAVKKLINKDLLCTERHEGDGRTKKIALTKAALERYKQLQKAMSSPGRLS